MGMSDASARERACLSRTVGARGYAPLESASRYINRELSWLDFNTRVLALAQDSAGRFWNG